MVETNNNDENEDTAVNGAAGGGGDAGVDAAEAGVTEGNYDAREARKRKNTKQQRIEQFHEKVLEVLKSPVEMATPAPPLLLLNQRLMWI